MQNTLAIGDKLTRPKALGLIQHVGVFLGTNTVLNNTPERGEHISTFREFAGEAKVKVESTGANPWSVKMRADKIVSNPKPYDPIDRNCEHTANEAVYGKPSSFQVALIGGALS